MDKQLRLFLVILGLLVAITNTAYANAGIGIFGTGFLHLLANVVIGFVEALFVRQVLKVPVEYGVIILANYVSMFAGYLFVVLLAPDVASYSYVPSNAWTMVPILFVASVFIEWPLFVRAVKNGSLKLSAASLRYTFYAQCVSYLLLIPLYATYDERLPVKDLVAMDLENLFANAYQYRLRPASMGGGEGSYAGYSISPSLASTEYGTYSVRVLHPDTVKFHARASEDTTWTVTVKIGPDGRPVAGSWVYTGQFV